MTLVILGSDNSTTWILVNSLAEEFEVSRVILEQPEPKRVYLRRRLRRFGFAHVAGQVVFRLLAMPLISRISAPRIAEIDKLHGLDDSPIDPSKIIHV